MGGTADRRPPTLGGQAPDPAGGGGEAHPSRRSQSGLDWLNFFIADVQTGFGPFVAVYLATHSWSPGEIGLVLTIGSLTAMASQTPGGMLVDAVEAKRLLIGIAIGLIAAGALIIALWPSFYLVAVAEVLHGSTGGMIRPALASLGLGLVGHAALSGRLGRNHRYDSLGNGLTALLLGLVGHFMAKRTTFFAVAFLCLPAVWALTRIDGREIDYARARSARDQGRPREAARWRDLARNRGFLVFIGCLMLFQFANASLMPLASGRLGLQHAAGSELVTAGMVAVPQAVAALIALRVAALADSWGRRPLLLIGFAVLPVRAALFTLVPGPWYLVAIQSLDGITAAVIGVMTPLVIADLVRGTGRYNFAQGIAGTAVGIGAGLSTAISGYVAQGFGYMAGFLGLAAVGLAGLGLVWWQMPETRPEEVGTAG
ncbi:MAG: MFS transporter [Acetobacteraceae bacterium]|nr:MFS transporter [Acetobacteraceae bacterium]